MTNPNGANQYKIDPRQINFLANYLGIESSTYSNCLQSGLKAGFSQEYSENLLNLMPKWLSESMDSLGDNKRLAKAEKVLDKTLEYEPLNEEGKLDNQLLKTQTDVAKFFAERLNKKKYSQRSELTGKEGKDLFTSLSEEDKEKLNKLLNNDS
jgi:hypothetical protein